jgi:hypothetical protein
LGVFEDEGAVFVFELTAEFGGDAGPEGSGRNDSVLGYDCAGGDDGAGADAGVVEDGCAHADDHFIFNNAAVDGGIVADGDPIADVNGIKAALAVEDGAVLDVGVGADADGVDVAAEDGVHPDGGTLTEDDVADELGGEIDVATCGELGLVALIAADHDSRPLKPKFRASLPAYGRCSPGVGGEPKYSSERS